MPEARGLPLIGPLGFPCSVPVTSLRENGVHPPSPLAYIPPDPETHGVLWSGNSPRLSSSYKSRLIVPFCDSLESRLSEYVKIPPMTWS